MVSVVDSPARRRDVTISTRAIDHKVPAITKNNTTLVSRAVPSVFSCVRRLSDSTLDKFEISF